MRAKNASRVFALTRVALDAMNELERIEDAMDSEARALYPGYVSDIQGFKLTFQHEYPERAEEYDDSAPFLEEAATVVADMSAEAEEAAAAALAAA